MLATASKRATYRDEFSENAGAPAETCRKKICALLRDTGVISFTSFHKCHTVERRVHAADKDSPPPAR